MNINLVSSLYRLDTNLQSFGRQLAGSIRIKYSDNKVNYNLLIEYPVVSLDGVYDIDLVRILSSRFSNGEHFKYYFELDFILSDGTVKVIDDAGVFRYALSDDDSFSSVSKSFVASVPLSISYSSTPITVVVDGISHVYQSDVPSVVTITPSSSLSINGEVYSKVESSYLIKFINSKGHWDWFIPNQVYQSVLINGLDIRTKSEGYFLDLRTNSRIKTTYEVYSDWVVDDCFVKDLILSPSLYFYDGVWYRSFIDETAVKYLDSHRDKLMQYVFKVTIGKQLVQ